MQTVWSFPQELKQSYQMIQQVPSGVCVQRKGKQELEEVYASPPAMLTEAFFAIVKMWKQL